MTLRLGVIEILYWILNILFFGELGALLSPLGVNKPIACDNKALIGVRFDAISG